MKKITFTSLSILAVSFIGLQQTQAQNTAPYWSLAGNSNASAAASKLGTTNSVPLRIYTKNAERIRIDTLGRVGVGVLSPTERLHVNSTTGNNALRVQVNGNTKLFVHSGGGTSFGGNVIPPANGVYIAGNVGIGTASPINKLHVVGRGRFTDGLSVESGGIYSSYLNGNGVEGYGNTTYGIGLYGSGFQGVYGYTGGGLSGQIGVYGYSGGYGIGVKGFCVNGSGTMGQSQNYVGVWGETGNTNSYAGYFNGNVYTTGSYLPSARKLKQNITELNSAMALIGKLQPKEYEYRHDGAFKLMNLPEGKRYGLIAEELEEVLPNLVKATDFDTRLSISRTKPATGNTPAQQTGGSDEKVDFKAVNYTELIPIVIKGMQEQQKQIEEQRQLIEAQQLQIEELKNLVGRLPKEQGGLSSVNGMLGQNTPNPANTTTRISYKLPAGSSRAQLLVTDAAGKTLKTVVLNASGFVNLSTASFSSGVYNYSLIADGKVLETKRLTITR